MWICGVNMTHLLEAEQNKANSWNDAIARKWIINVTLALAWLGLPCFASIFATASASHGMNSFPSWVSNILRLPHRRILRTFNPPPFPPQSLIRYSILKYELNICLRHSRSKFNAKAFFKVYLRFLYILVSMKIMLRREICNSRTGTR